MSSCKPYTPIKNILEFFRDPARLGLVKLGIAMGILLRVKGYLEERSLWGDECWSAIEIMNRTFGEILRNEHIFLLSSRPPMLFVLIEKTFVTLFGNSEYVLRFPPLLFSILSIYLFYRIGKKYLSPQALTIAIWLLAFSEPLLYHAAEARRYSTSVFSAMLLGYLATHFLLPRQNGRRILCFGLLAAVIAWLSYASLFVTVAVFFTLGIKSLSEKRFKCLPALALAAIPVLISVGLLYQSVWDGALNSNEMRGYFKSWLWQGQGLSFATIAWLQKIFMESVHNPGGLSYPAMKVFLMMLGLLIFIRRHRWDAIIFALPIALVLFAALLGAYPFYGRLILFLAPAYYLLISYGLDFLLERFSRKNFLIFCAAMVFIFATPAANAISHLTQSLPTVDNRQMLTFFSKNYQPGDRVFINDGARYPYYYYASSLGYGLKIEKEKHILPKGSVMLAPLGIFMDETFFSRDERVALLVYEHLYFDKNGAWQAAASQAKTPFRIMTRENLDLFLGEGRTWLLFSNSDEKMRTAVEEHIRPFFLTRGKEILSYEGSGVSARLYDIAN